MSNNSMSAQHTPGPKRLKGHALDIDRNGAAYARGRCKCGWVFKGWSHHNESVRVSYRSHIAVEALRIAKATGSAA